MNILNLDCIHDLGTIEQQGICPEWVNMERLYNCEDFYLGVKHQKSLLRKLFGKKWSFR